MAVKTDIEWAHATLNFWYGCHKVSDGCTYCYMYRDMPRYGRDPNVVTRSKTFYDSLKWAKSGKLKPGSRIFVCSWSDFFIEEADDWRSEAWDIIKQTPQFTYLILTKRVDNILDRLPPDWGDGYPNVWLGPTVESDKYLWRIEKILQIPVAKRIVSMEPLLGPVDMRKYIWVAPENQKISWVVVGGESGPKARPMNPLWVRFIRDQCQTAGIPFFFKQWGEWSLDSGDYSNLPYGEFHGMADWVKSCRCIQGTQEMVRIGKKRAGCILDGRQWREYPS